eukprot:2369851-Rhodomonas_salina.1
MAATPLSNYAHITTNATPTSSKFSRALSTTYGPSNSRAWTGSTVSPSNLRGLTTTTSPPEISLPTKNPINCP